MPSPFVGDLGPFLGLILIFVVSFLRLLSHILQYMQELFILPLLKVLSFELSNKTNKGLSSPN